MSDWKIIVPVETTNFVTNPSFETNTTGWTNVGMTIFARQSTFSKFGSYALRMRSDATTDTVDGNTVSEADAGETWTASCWVWLIFGDFELVIEENAGGWTEQASIATTTTSKWVYLKVTTTLDGGVTDARVVLKPSAVAASEFFVDAVQFEQQSEATTHCDGDQPGCEWNGAAHASTSTRSALSRAGGFVKDLKDDYYFGVIDVLGFGMPQLTVAVDGYAILPGGQLNSIKTNPRVGTLIGVFKDPTDAVGCDLHEMRQTLLEELAHDKYPKSALGWQPVILRYVGADVTKEIAVHYESGLGANIRLENRIHEKASIRFRAPDPFWYEIGETSTELDTNDTATIRYASGRLKSIGQWDDLGLSSAGLVWAILQASDGSVYWGGDFIDLDGVAGRNYIARYIPATDSWETVGPGSSVNGRVRSIKEAPNGDIYIGGSFTNVGGATGDYVAFWDISGGSWQPVAAGGTGTVFDIAFGPDGTLYIGGNFLNWNAIAAADYIVMWNGAAYAAMAGTVLGALVQAVTVRNSDGQVFIGGNFVNAGGDADADYVAQHDGTDFSALASSVLNNVVHTLALDINNDLYVGGEFTNAGDVNGDHIVMWNGTSFVSLGTGLNNWCLFLTVRDGFVWAGGTFTEAGDITTTKRIAKFNGTSWSNLDVSFAGVPIVEAIALGPPDPVVERNFNIWVGPQDTGVAQFAGAVTVTNNGTTLAWPVITVNRSGGTTATLTSIRNEILGLELLFDYALLDGETLTIDLDPTTGSIVSSFFGQREDAILANSDRGQWAIQVGDNDVTAFVDVAGGPTITAFLIFKTPYKSFD